MMSNRFEESLDRFMDCMDRKDSEGVYQALFEIIRISFSLGWRSAGGEPPQEEHVFQLLAGGQIEQPEKPEKPEKPKKTKKALRRRRLKKWKDWYRRKKRNNGRLFSPRH